MPPTQFTDEPPLGLDSATSIPLPAGRTGQGTRSRVVIAALAAGAFAAAGTGSLAHAAQPSETTDAGGTADQDGAAPAADRLPQRMVPVVMPQPAHTVAQALARAVSPDVLPAARPADPASEARQMAAGQQAVAAQAPRSAAATRPRFVRPTHGTFTSGFAARWGSFHYGVDLAAPKGTPILAAADGRILDAGPAHGFGLWVREQLPDGTVLVYGHMDDFGVRAGQHVRAGQQIARVGNRGEATGYHLHFEVWAPSGKKVDPRPWLAERGVTL